MRRLLSVIPVLFLLVPLNGCGDDDPAAPPETPLSLRLVDEARTCVREVCEEAIIMRVVGWRRDGELLNHPDEADTLAVLAAAAGDTNGLQAWRLTYNGTWRREELSGDILGVVYVDMADVEMSAARAWELATAAGYGDPCTTWTLVQTLHPDVPNPFFAFQYVCEDFVFVDTVTGAVHRGN